ncbi:LysR family transcriptional regulator [Bordetella petrii]|uniref:LysR family transcriptional regulator n=1 Tax=Bordetella petrii TaxID=94624 RepID=UPI001E3F3C95|nr:LysR family transcriptional regulator [Bordetella petrii]MCD0502203.1 LysR family transcriptional regulator [Bordetella petrii]
MRYELTDIRVFMAIADAKNLTTGAVSMHMTAPSASYRLKNLERTLGVSLFERTVKGMSLTSAGEAVYRYGEAMLAHADGLQTEIAKYHSDVTGHIRVFANSSTLNALPGPVSRFLARFPTINIELEEHLSEESVRAVHEGIADIGLVASVTHLGRLEAYEYAQDELVFVTAVGHPLAGRKRIPVDMALAHELVSVGKQSSNFLYLQQVAGNLNKRMNVRIHMPSFEAALRCVQAGAGICMVPLSLARGWKERGLVGIVRLNEPWAKRNQMIVIRSMAALPDYAREFVRTVMEEV